MKDVPKSSAPDHPPNPCPTHTFWNSQCGSSFSRNELINVLESFYFFPGWRGLVDLSCRQQKSVRKLEQWRHSLPLVSFSWNNFSSRSCFISKMFVFYFFSWVLAIAKSRAEGLFVPAAFVPTRSCTRDHGATEKGDQAVGPDSLGL